MRTFGLPAVSLFTACTSPSWMMTLTLLCQWLVVTYCKLPLGLFSGPTFLFAEWNELSTVCNLHVAYVKKNRISWISPCSVTIHCLLISLLADFDVVLSVTSCDLLQVTARLIFCILVRGRASLLAYIACVISICYSSIRIDRISLCDFI